MSAPRFAGVGGDVLQRDGRPVPLDDAEALIAAWGRAAMLAEAEGRLTLARDCARDALDLHAAFAAALRWRRAAG
ncbi:hypothetical protein ACO2Q3_12125 [Caulobacter sp. KR2-114]|uniref:hypothetical protein n=1 Tax=Caulobacter sp. KR2-114 TaxID=3400912 RepID=UPI003C04F601